MPFTLARSPAGPKLAEFLHTYLELRIEMTLRGRMNPIAEPVDVVLQI
jgi:hypothetical protein